MEIPKDLRYSRDHEWVMVEEDEALIGITDYAQSQLGEVVYVDMPAEGDTFEADEAFGEIESVKSVSELVIPLGGEIIAINDEIEDNPGLVNEDPYGEGWLVRIRIENEDEISSLLTPEQYEATLDQLQAHKKAHGMIS